MRAALILAVLLLLTGWKHVVMPAPVLGPDGKTAISTAWQPSLKAEQDAQARVAAVQSTATGKIVVAKPVLSAPAATYHAIVPDDFDDSQAIYSASWDGGPCVKVTKGSVYERTLGFLGWPMIDCADYVLQKPPK